MTQINHNADGMQKPEMPTRNQIVVLTGKIRKMYRTIFELCDEILQVATRLQNIEAM